MDKTVQKRDSNIELMRIICMFLIVMNHAVNHANISKNWSIVDINRIFMELIAFGQIAVSCFVLITGYFSTYKKNTNIRKLVYLVLLTDFYSIVLFAVAVWQGIEKVTLHTLWYNIFPVINNKYWFITAYVGMSVCIAALNAMVSAMDRKMHRNVCLTATVMFSVIPTILDRQVWGDRRLVWFISLYLIGSYLRRYPIEWMNRKRAYLCLTGLIAFLVVWKVTIDIMSMNHTGLRKYINYPFNEANKFPVLVISVAILLAFIYTKIPYTKWINYVASSTLAVYIIHDNSYMRYILWTKIFRVAQIYPRKFFPLYVIGISLIVFAVCIFIDKIRIAVINAVRKLGGTNGQRSITGK